MKRFFWLIAFLYVSLQLFAQTPQWLWANTAGSPNVDSGRGIAHDAAGNTYVTGFYQGTCEFGDITLTSTESSTDAFIAKADANGNWLWARSTVGIGSETAYAIATDVNGNSFITGEFGGSVTFGGSTITSSYASSSVFVACIDATGLWLWAAGSGGGYGEERGTGIALNGSGNCYITGYLKGNAVFGEDNLNTNSGEDSGIFVAKLDTGGNWVWAKSAGGSSWLNHAAGTGIACSTDGNISLTGWFSGIIDFTIAELTYEGFVDAFVAEINPNGDWQWAKRAGGTMADYSNAIARDGSGNTYVTGYYNITADFGNMELTAVGGQADVFVAKLNPEGSWLWAISGAGFGDDQGRGIAIDANGNCYVSGHYSSSITFGTNNLNSIDGSTDIFVAKTDTNGNWQWAVSAGGIGEDVNMAISTDSEGFSYITGYYSNTANFGTIPIISQGMDIFIAKLSSGDVANEDDVIPVTQNISRLYNAYPNPFRTGEIVNIKADVLACETGTLSVFNLKGQCIEKHILNKGIHQISLNSKGLATGIYFYQLRTNKSNEVKKLVLIK